MTKAATVHVPPGTLRWGRDRAKADIAEAAAKCGHDVASLTAWEDGDEDPPLTALRELATFYLVLTSNLHPAAFDTILPKGLATATVDRLLHHAHIVVTEGRSQRLEDALAGRGVGPLARPDPDMTGRRREHL